MMPEPVTEQDATAAVIKKWSESAILAKQLAAKIALEIASLPPNTVVESSLRIQVKYATSYSVAIGARNLLAGANLIHKEGRRYCTGRAEATESNTPEVDR